MSTSAGAWAFYTANSVAVLEVLRQVIVTKRKAKQAVANTQNVSNGFANKVTSNLDEIKRLTLLNTEAQTEMQKELNRTNRALDHTNQALQLHLNGHSGRTIE